MSTDRFSSGFHSYDSEASIFTAAPATYKAPREFVAPVRVLHVVNGEHYAGAERVQDLLAMQLPEYGFQIEFACVKAKRFPTSRQSNVPLHALSMYSRLDLRSVLRVARIVKEGEHEIIHAHTPRSAIVGSLAARLTRVPFVYHVHSPTSQDHINRWWNLFNHWNERFFVRRADALIAVSESLGQHMRLRGYSDDAVYVVRNGSPAPMIKRSPASPTGEWTVGAVALFRPKKGLEVLLDAIAQLTAKGIFVNLRAVGAFATKKYREQVMEHVAWLGIFDQVEWIEFTEDVSSEMAKMDVIAFPSLFGEGLPMAVLEAMAAGVPVIGSRLDGIPEAIDDGINGLLVEPGNPTELAEKIRQFVTGELDWHGLRENGMRTHSVAFSYVRMVEGVAEVYRRVLAQSAARTAAT